MGCTGATNRKESARKVNLRPEEIASLKETTLCQTSIEMDYTVIKKLKEGPCAKYYLVNNKYNSKDFCMKVIKRDKSTEDQNYILKFSQLKKLSHPYLISTIDIYEDEVNFYFITELPKGRELFETMKEHTNFNENTAGKIFYQLASVLFFFHSKGLYHGFLRPESISLEYEIRGNKIIHKSMSADTDGTFSLTMTEFGEVANFSASYYDEAKRIEKIGKPYYTAPEILKKRPFDQKIDVFTAGVILFIMLCGKPPFYGIDNNDIKQAICDGDWDFEGTEWKDVSAMAKDLIRKMLNPIPEKRISSKDVLLHQWVVLAKEDKTFSCNVISSVNKNLANFYERDQLQQATLAFISNQISCSNQVKDLKKLFQEFDQNGDGILSYQEFEAGYVAMYGKGLQGVEMESILASIDKDGSGNIDYEEFLSATTASANLINDQNLKAAFTKFDKDGSGKLSMSELKGIVGSDIGLITELLKKVDKNNDGEISFEEFKRLMTMMAGYKEKLKKPKDKPDKKGKKQQSKNAGTPDNIKELMNVRISGEKSDFKKKKK